MCQVPEHEAVQLCSAATCVAACFPRGRCVCGGLFKVYVCGRHLTFGGYSVHLLVGHSPPLKVLSL